MGIVTKLSEFVHKPWNEPQWSCNIQDLYIWDLCGYILTIFFELFLFQGGMMGGSGFQ